MIQFLAIYIFLSGPFEWLVGQKALPGVIVAVMYYPIGVLIDLDLCPDWLVSWLLMWTP